MKLGYLAYTGLIAAAVALSVGTALPSYAAKKKMAAAEPLPPSCWFLPEKNVCGDYHGVKMTYFNSCYAGKDGAKVTSQGACKPAKMASKKMSKTKKKM